MASEKQPAWKVDRPRPLRVMHVLYKFGVGGMEVGITKLVNALDPATIQSSICSGCEGDSLKERLRPGIPLFEMDRQGGNDPRFVARLYRLFKRERPDVIHTHRWATLCEGIIAARLAGVPFVVHGEHGTLETRSHNAWVQRKMWRRVDRVLSVSSRLAERMARDINFPLDRIQVIRNGVDLNRFGRQHASEVRRELGVATGELLIGSVGRLVDVKDHPNFLQALTVLRDRGIPCRAVVAGAGPLHEELVALASRLGLSNVSFLGNRNDVPRLLGAFDVFVLSSRSEGLSNTIQEAMATGLPIVATRVGGADELIVDGETGMLVPPAAPAALAEALAAFASDPQWRERAGAAARRRAESLFGLDRMITEYEQLYLSLGDRQAGEMRQVQVNEA